MLSKEAVEKIVELGNVKIEEIEGVNFHVTPKGAVAVEYPNCETVNLFSLTQLVNFISFFMADGSEPKLVNVADFQSVSFVDGELNDNLDIDVIAKTSFDKMFELFPFGTQIKQDQFIINIMTRFQDTEERKALLKFVSSVRAEKVRTSDDDGFTQVAAMKSGVHLTSEKPVQNLWALQPFKTFPEITQPTIPYILRLHQKDEEMPAFALYECDGGLWKVNLTIQVREYLKRELSVALGEKSNLVTVL